MQYLNNKRCEVCNTLENDDEMLLCDRCDDAYHLYCHFSKSQNIVSEEETWFCETCEFEINLFESREKTKEIDVYKEKCYKCSLMLTDELIEAMNEFQESIKITNFNLKPRKCLYCKEFYHFSCFSKRENALNCEICERKIRKEGPKSHKEFISYIESQTELIKETKFISLEDDNGLCLHSNIRYKHLGLKIPVPMTTWQTITQHDASIYYALTTKRIIFVDEQIYASPAVLEMNDYSKEVNIASLSELDEQTFIRFKENSRKGYIGPFEVREDKIKGFYLVATEFIEKMTIVSEYVGEVMTSRNALNDINNDSIFMLLRTPRSKESLDVVPTRHGNISRFFCGVNNLKREEFMELENIKVVRFAFQKRIRLLFYTSKNVQASSTLYFNYNGGAFSEYPTEHFIK